MHYYMFNKPYGCVSARTDDLYPTVIDYFSEMNNENLSPVGRLDRETEGLLLITDDGKWNQKITHPVHQIEKTYEFTALGMLDDAKINALETGVMLIGAKTLTAPARVEVTGESILTDVLPTLPPEIQKKTAHNHPKHPVVYGRITITEGKKHQVRRMLKAVGCCIVYLKRISIGSLVLPDSLPKGSWVEIPPDSLDL